MVELSNQPSVSLASSSLACRLPSRPHAAALYIRPSSAGLRLPGRLLSCQQLGQLAAGAPAIASLLAQPPVTRWPLLCCCLLLVLYCISKLLGCRFGASVLACAGVC